VARAGEDSALIWGPYGARTATPAELRQLIIQTGFPLVIKDVKGGYLFDPARPEETEVVLGEDRVLRLIVWNGVDRPGTVRVSMVLSGGRIRDDDGGVWWLVRDN
jgi:hypothetical protein